MFSFLYMSYIAIFGNVESEGLSVSFKLCYFIIDVERWVLSAAQSQGGEFSDVGFDFPFIFVLVDVVDFSFCSSVDHIFRFAGVSDDLCDVIGIRYI